MSGQSQSGESQTMAIKMPQNGTIVKTSGMEGSVAQQVHQLLMLTI